MIHNDDAKPQVAPPPPPPAEVRRILVSARGGFRPGGRRMVVEVTVILAIVLGLGALVVAGGGALAAAMTPLVPIGVDQTLGRVSAAQLAAATPSCTNPEAEAYVKALAAPLLEAAGELPYTFTFRVADDPAINAFALPGGYVTVNRGLLEAAESGEEVAGVLGHEIQHALLRHGTRRVLRQMGSAALLSLLFGGSDVGQIAGAAGQLTSLSYDRDQEGEADEQGVELLLRAEVNPAGLARFFERLGEREQAKVPAFISTHPDPGDRARLIAAAIARGAGFRDLPSPDAIRCHKGPSAPDEGSTR